MIAGRYRLGDLLGRGGMADVYDGLDLRLERAVAVKLLRPEMAARDDVRTRFEAEARAAAGLSHPNAVAVFDTGEHEGVPYLVMERLPGTTLADRIAEGPVDPVWVCGAACGVLGALAVAHEAGIVHRDVKPGNILVAADGTAKIADFGIAKSVSPSDGSTGGKDLTATGQLLGTPAYLAPERIEGEPASPRSDLWALGVVLYEALTGEKPFTGRTPLEVASAVVSGNYVPLLTRRPDVDPLLASTVERAMATDPERRFATAGGMAAALRGGADATVMSGDGAVRDGTMVLPVLDVQPRRRPGRSPIWARHPWVGWGVLALLVLVLVLGVARADRTPPESIEGDGSAAAAEQAATAPTPEQSLAQTLRDMAAGLSPAKDGARAGELADGLRRVADALESGSAGAGTQATGLIVSAATWHQTGQLTQAATVAAVQALQQVPGVQLTSQSPPPTVAAPDGSAGVSPVAPATGNRATEEGNGKGKDRGDKNDEKGAGKDDD